MANIRELLEATLAKRRPVAAHVEQVIRQLGEATSAISVLQRTLDKEQPGHPASGTASALVSEAEQLSRQLNTVRQRFARNSLNIGVIGRARQGKSRLLQSITGLSSAEIPDGNRQHCTGVRSVITHQKTGATYGDVYFYTEAQFLDAVIQPYFTALNLGNPPLTLQEFAGSLPPPRIRPPRQTIAPNISTLKSITNG